MNRFVFLFLLLLFGFPLYAASISDTFTSFSPYMINDSNVVGGHIGKYNGVYYQYLTDDPLGYVAWQCTVATSSDLIHWSPSHGNVLLDVSDMPSCLASGEYTVASLVPLVDTSGNLLKENGYFWGLWSKFPYPVTPASGCYTILMRCSTPNGAWEPYYPSNPCDTAHGGIVAQASGWAVNGAFITGFMKDDDGTYYATGSHPYWTSGGAFYTSDYTGSWTYNSTALLTPTAGLGEGWIHDMMMRKYSGTYYLFYTRGNAAGNSYATCSTPLGSYTKYAGNPIITTGFTCPIVYPTGFGTSYYHYTDVELHKHLFVHDSLTPTSTLPIWLTSNWGVLGGGGGLVYSTSTAPSTSGGVLSIPSGGSIISIGNTALQSYSIVCSVNWKAGNNGSKYIGVVDSPYFDASIQNKVTIGTKSGGSDLYLWTTAAGTTTETSLGSITDEYHTYALTISTSFASVAIDSGTPTVVSTNIPQEPMNFKAANVNDSTNALLLDSVTYEYTDQAALPNLGPGYQGTASWH